MWTYKARAVRDVARWHRAGWVTDEGAQAITAELETPSRGYSASSILAISGVVLLGFGAMSFVAANWSEIPKLARLTLLFVLSASSYAAAAALFGRGHRGFAHASVLLGVALFGASIMLIAQMYHVSGRPRDMVMIWAAIAFVSGIASRSSPSTSAALVLTALWSAWESTELEAIHWMFLPAWLAISAALFWQRAAFGLYLAGAAMTIWLISLGYPWWGGGTSHLIPLTVGILASVAFVVAELADDDAISRVGRVGLGFALLVIIGALSGMQYLPTGDISKQIALDQYIILAAIKLVVLVAAMWWCVERENSGVLWLAYILFSMTVLAIYFKTVGSLLGSAVFFLAAGLIVIGLAWFAHLLANRATSRNEVRP